MPSLFTGCFGCGGKKREIDEVRILDLRHMALTDVPPEVFESERTLEELLLDSNQLTSLPRQLFLCHGLRCLNLSDNELTTLPPAISSLIQLASLDISKNAISGLPDNIKGCKHLAVVDASLNPLCRLPEGVTQLLSLTQLFLNDTFLEFLPANFGRLSQLQILELRENQLNTLPKSMARLTSLSRLDFGQNDFSEMPEVIGSLVALKELWCDNNKIKSLPPVIGKLTRLVHLDASKNRIDWVAKDIVLCHALTDLCLSSNDLKELPESLGGCTSLQNLHLDDNVLASLPNSFGRLALLEQLVACQNELSVLPPSIGLLRALRFLHLDDNHLQELPQELGSCTSLTVLSVSSNQLTELPAELGHLHRLVVLNVCGNSILHLPVSFAKLKLRALWLSENQAKPLVTLQADSDPSNGQRVLTCFMLPQQANTKYTTEKSDENHDLFPGAAWEEQRRSKTLIKFAFDGEMDKPGRLTRAPTPYPKELKALARHARSRAAQRSGAGQAMVEAVSVAGKESDGDISRVETTSVEKVLQNGIEHRDNDQPSTDDNISQVLAPDEESSIPLPPAEETPLPLRHARNIRSSNASLNSSSDAPSNYTFGDQKIIGVAQVISTSKGIDPSPSPPSPPPPVQDSPPPSTSPVHDSPPPPPSQPPPASSPSPSPQSSPPREDSPPSPIKSPPPYHIAAALSKHAGEFGVNTSQLINENAEEPHYEKLPKRLFPQRPGSLAVADTTSILSRLPSAGARPGSLAFPPSESSIAAIIPPRALSQMNLNTSFSLASHSALSVGPPRFGKMTGSEFTPVLSSNLISTNLVSTIDQVTSTLMDVGDSPLHELDTYYASPCNVSSESSAASNQQLRNGGFSTEQSSRLSGRKARGSLIPTTSQSPESQSCSKISTEMDSKVNNISSSKLSMIRPPNAVSINRSVTKTHNQSYLPSTANQMHSSPVSQSHLPAPKQLSHLASPIAQSPAAILQPINTTGIPILPSFTRQPSLTLDSGYQQSITGKPPSSTSKIPQISSVSKLPKSGSPVGVTSRLQAPGWATGVGRGDRVGPSNPSGASLAWQANEPSPQQEHIFPVVIEKNPGLGFTLGPYVGNKGVVVTSVISGGPASSALRVGDRILEVDGRDLRSAAVSWARSVLSSTQAMVSLTVARTQ